MSGVPWFIGSNGALHPPEVARSLSYAALNGGEGVVGPGHLKVQATATPSGNIRATPGTVGVLNRYPNASFQSYLSWYPNEVVIPISPTGSSAGRTDLVVARISDPDYAGTIPADPVNGPYQSIAVIAGVPAGTTKASALNLGYPAVELARVTLPASTATVTNAMITDLRSMANGRRDRSLHISQIATQQDLTSSTYVDFPSSYKPTVHVPTWATHVNLIATISGAYNVTSSVAGTIQARLGTVVSTPETQYDTPQTSGTDPNAETMIMARGPVALTPAVQGTNQVLSIQARRTNGSGSMRLLVGRTTVMFDIEFLERPW